MELFRLEYRSAWENSDLELEEEEIEQAGELGSPTNPLYSSSEDKVEEPQRKRRRRGRERTESSSVCEHLNSSESDGNDTDSSSNLFAEDSNDEDFGAFEIIHFSGENLLEK